MAKTDSNRKMTNSAYVHRNARTLETGTRVFSKAAVTSLIILKFCGHVVG